MAGENLIKDVRAKTRQAIMEALNTIESARPKIIFKRGLADILKKRMQGERLMGRRGLLRRLRERIGSRTYSYEEPVVYESTSYTGAGEASASGLYEGEERKEKQGWLY